MSRLGTHLSATILSGHAHDGLNPVAGSRDVRERATGGLTSSQGSGTAIRAMLGTLVDIALTPGIATAE